MGAFKEGRRGCSFDNLFYMITAATKTQLQEFSSSVLWPETPG